MRVFLSFFAMGVAYSLGLRFVGGWLSLYLPTLTLVHSVLLGGVFGTVAWISTKLVQRRWLRTVLVAGIILSYFGGWLFGLSAVNQEAWWVQVSVFLVCTGLVGGLSWWVFRRTGPSSIGTAVLVLVSLVVLLGSCFLLRYLPVRMIATQHEAPYPNQTLNYSDVLYPVTVPVEEALGRYGFLVSYDPSNKVISMVVVDALRKDHVGREVNGKTITPTIDSVAGDGVKFDNYYVQGSWTKPSTASLFTGTYIHDHGTCIMTRKYGQKLSSQYLTLAEKLNRSGYQTMGSAFVSHLNRRFQFGQGFDFWLVPDTGYQSDINSLRILLFKLARTPSDKVFLYYHVQGPHSPFRKALLNRRYWKRTKYYSAGSIKFPKWELGPPAEFTKEVLGDWKKESERPLSFAEIKIIWNLYASQLNFYDREHFNRLLTGMKGLGIYDNTFLLIAGDHGEQLFDGLRDGEAEYSHYRNLHRAVINPALVMKLPSKKYSNYHQSIQRLPFLESIDLTASFLDYAGRPAGRVKGHSFLNVLGSTGEFHDSFTYGLTERCGLSKKFDLGSASPAKLRETLRIVNIVFPSTKGLLRHNFVKGRSRVFKRKGDEYKPIRSNEAPGLIKTLMRKYNTSVGSDSSFQRNPGALLPLREETRQNLRGLGYVN